MATVQNLEVVVEVDIGKALAALTELQDELREVAEQIEMVDAIGTEGISVRASIDDLDSEAAAFLAQVEAIEQMADIRVGSSIGAVGIGGGLDAASMSMMRSLMGGGGGSGTPDSLLDTIRQFDIRMSDIHNLLATLVPLLIVFIGAIPAAITAMVGLATAAVTAAAALFAIGGLGALGAAAAGGGMPSMENLEEFWTDIRDAFLEAFMPLAERLEPVFLDALDGLERFFMAIAGEGDALVSLVDEVRAFGRFLTEFMPRALRALSATTEALAPILADLGQFLTDNIVNILRGLTAATLDAMPAIAELAGIIMRALPAIIQLSIGFARVAAVVIQFIGLMFDVLTLFGLFNEEALGVAIASLLTLATVLALVVKILGVLSAKALFEAAAQLVAFALDAIVAAQSMGALAIAINAAKWALIGFLAVTGIGLVLAGLGTLIGGLQSEFLGFADSVDVATGSLKDFDRVSRGMSGSGFSGGSPYGGGPGGSGGATGSGRGGGTTVQSTRIEFERTGDRDDDKSDADKLAWRRGRTSGSGA